MAFLYPTQIRFTTHLFLLFKTWLEEMLRGNKDDQCGLSLESAFPAALFLPTFFSNWYKSVLFLPFALFYCLLPLCSMYHSHPVFCTEKVWNCQWVFAAFRLCLKIPKKMSGDAIIGSFAKSVTGKSLTELFARLWPEDHWILAPTWIIVVFTNRYVPWLCTHMTVSLSVYTALQFVYRKSQKYFSHMSSPLSYVKILSLKGDS